MNTKELISLLKTNDLYPILVESNSSKDENTDLTMVGVLEDFINSAKALNEKIIFVNVEVLEEEDFIYDGNLESLDESETENEDFSGGLDLATVVPKLRDYKKYLDKECIYGLSLLYGSSTS